MIIIFCGHSDFEKSKEYEEKILEFLDSEICGASAEMYLGGYGQFDEFAYFCCKKYKKASGSGCGRTVQYKCNKETIGGTPYEGTYGHRQENCHHPKAKR